MRRIRRYLALAGCGGRAEEALEEVERNLRWLLGALGEAEVDLEIKERGDPCVVRIDLPRGGLLDAVIFAASISSVGGRYLRPLMISGTVRGLRAKVIGRARAGGKGG